MAEIKRWTRPIWESRKDVVLRQRTLTVLPFSHVHRDIFFIGSADRTNPCPQWGFRPVFTPATLRAEWFGLIPTGHSTDADFGTSLVAQLTTCIDKDLAPITSVEDFYRVTSGQRPPGAGGLWQLSRNGEFHAVVLAALGRLE
ncbi:hypothetical protein [Devosia sp.]|uniref:hypothetical protein n=1 Tax=Devosia sp. TaxID=1871048 RepID=UPI003265FD85